MDKKMVNGECFFHPQLLTLAAKMLGRSFHVVLRKGICQYLDVIVPILGGHHGQDLIFTILVHLSCQAFIKYT